MPRGSSNGELVVDIVANASSIAQTAKEAIEAMAKSIAKNKNIGDSVKQTIAEPFAQVTANVEALSQEVQDLKSVIQHPVDKSGFEQYTKQLSDLQKTVSVVQKTVADLSQSYNNLASKGPIDESQTDAILARLNQANEIAEQAEKTASSMRQILIPAQKASAAEYIGFSPEEAMSQLKAFKVERDKLNDENWNKRLGVPKDKNITDFSGYVKNYTEVLKQYQEAEDEYYSNTDNNDIYDQWKERVERRNESLIDLAYADFSTTSDKEVLFNNIERANEQVNEFYQQNKAVIDQMTAAETKYVEMGQAVQDYYALFNENGQFHLSRKVTKEVLGGGVESVLTDAREKVATRANELNSYVKSMQSVLDFYGKEQKTVDADQALFNFKNGSIKIPLKISTTSKALTEEIKQVVDDVNKNIEESGLTVNIKTNVPELKIQAGQIVVDGAEIKQTPKSTGKKSQSKTSTTPPQPPTPPAPPTPSEPELKPTSEESPKSSKKSGPKKSRGSKSTKGKTSTAKEPTPFSNEILTDEAKDPDKEYIQDVIPRLRQEIADLSAKVKPREEFEASVRESLSALQEGDRYTAEAFEALVKEQTDRLYSEQPELTEIANKTDRLNNLEAIQARMDAANKNKATNKQIKSSTSDSKKGSKSKSKTSKSKSSSYVSPYADMSDAMIQRMMAEKLHEIDSIDESIAKGKEVEEKLKDRAKQYDDLLAKIKEQETKIKELTESDYKGNENKIASLKQNTNKLNEQLKALSKDAKEYKSTSSALKSLNRKKKDVKHDYNSLKWELDKRNKQPEEVKEENPQVEKDVRTKQANKSNSKSKSQSSYSRKNSSSPTMAQLISAKLNEELPQKKAELAEVEKAQQNAQKEYHDLNEQAKKLSDDKGKIGEEQKKLDQLLIRLSIAQADRMAHPEDSSKADAVQQQVDEQQAKVFEMTKALPDKEQQEKLAHAISLARQKLVKVGAQKEKIEGELAELEALEKTLLNEWGQEAGVQSKSVDSKNQINETEDNTEEIDTSALDAEINEKAQLLEQTEKNITSLEEHLANYQNQRDSILKEIKPVKSKMASSGWKKLIPYLPSEKGPGKDFSEERLKSLFSNPKADEGLKGFIRGIQEYNKNYSNALDGIKNAKDSLQECYADRDDLEEQIAQLKDQKEQAAAKPVSKRAKAPDTIETSPQSDIQSIEAELVQKTEEFNRIEERIASLRKKRDNYRKQRNNVLKEATKLSDPKNSSEDLAKTITPYLPSKDGVGKGVPDDLKEGLKSSEVGSQLLDTIQRLKDEYTVASKNYSEAQKSVDEACKQKKALTKQINKLNFAKDKAEKQPPKRPKTSSTKSTGKSNSKATGAKQAAKTNTDEIIELDENASSMLDDPALESGLAKLESALKEEKAKLTDAEKRLEKAKSEYQKIEEEQKRIRDIATELSQGEQRLDWLYNVYPESLYPEGTPEGELRSTRIKEQTEKNTSLRQQVESNKVRGQELLKAYQQAKQELLTVKAERDQIQADVNNLKAAKNTILQGIQEVKGQEVQSSSISNKGKKSALKSSSKSTTKKPSTSKVGTKSASNEPTSTYVYEEDISEISSVRPEQVQQLFDAFDNSEKAIIAKERLTDFVEVLKTLKRLLEELQQANGVEDFIRQVSKISPVITKLNTLVESAYQPTSTKKIGGTDKQFLGIASYVKDLLPNGKFTIDKDEKIRLLSQIGTALQNYWQAGGTKQVKDFNDVLGFKLKGGQAKAIQKAADSATPSVEKPQTRFEKLAQQITELTNGPIDQLYEKLKTIQGLLSGDVWSNWSKDIKDLTKVFTDSVNQLDKMIKKLTQLMGLKDEVEEEGPSVKIKDFPTESGGGGGPKLPSTRVRKNRSGGGFNNFEDFTSDFWNRWDYYYGNAPQTFAKRHQSINTQSSALSTMQLFGAPVNENYSLDLSNFLPGVDEAVDNVKAEWQKLTTVFQENQDIFWKYVIGSRQIDDDDLAIVQSWIERTKALTKDVATLNKQYQSGSILRNASQGTIVESTFGKVEDVDQARKSIQELASAFNATGTFTANGSKFVGTFTQANGEVQKLSLSWDKVNKAIRQTTELQSTANLSTLLSSSIKATTADLSRFVAMTFSTQRALSKVAESLREGWQAFKDYDAAMTSVKYTMDMTEEQFDSLGKSTIQMAKDLNLSIQDAMGITQIYANMQTTPEEILTVARPTAILSNLAGIDTSTAANEIQSVLQQFQMSEEEAAHVVDIYDKVSANIKIDYAAGIEDIAQGVQTAGQVAADAGVSFAELASLIGKVAERTREDGSSIGNALKTIIVRLSKASELSGADEVDTNTLSDASKALHDVGVEVYNLDGSFRPLMTILGELSAKWNDLSDAQQANISYAVAATRLT